MIVFALIGYVPVAFGISLAISDALGVWWQIAAIPFLACFGVWVGGVTARSER